MAAYTLTWTCVSPDPDGARRRGAVTVDAGTPFHVALDNVLTAVGAVTFDDLRVAMVRAAEAGAVVIHSAVINILAKAVGAFDDAAEMACQAALEAATTRPLPQPSLN